MAKKPLIAIIILVILAGLYGVVTSLKDSGIPGQLSTQRPSNAPSESFGIAIALADQECATDDDCAVIGDDCSSCSCGSPVNKTQIDKYTRQFDEVCKEYRGPICDYLCSTPVSRCISNRCVLVPFEEQSDTASDSER